MKYTMKAHKLLDDNLPREYMYEKLTTAIAAALLEAERDGMEHAAEVAQKVTALDYGGIQKRDQIVVAIHVAAAEITEAS